MKNGHKSNKNSDTKIRNKIEDREMENVRCQDGAPEALLENYRALGTVVSIIGRHLPRPAKQVPPW